MPRPTNAQLAQLFGILTFLYVGAGSVAPKIVNFDKSNVGYMLALVGYFLKPPSEGYNSPEGASDATEGE
jgi:hypothetical protein